jgi:hypothetical protein
MIVLAFSSPCSARSSGVSDSSNQPLTSVVRLQSIPLLVRRRRVLP